MPKIDATESDDEPKMCDIVRGAYAFSTTTVCLSSRSMGILP